ncbi:MAG: hypothetical protein FD119_2601 [Stygiobacter sp.]|nr:MAG: hypothetical protein FD119_2601 [Stygiobacter sp.]
MLRRLLAVGLMTFALSGCFKAKFASVVDGKGNVKSQAEVVTNMLFSGMLDEHVKRLRSQGIPVNVSLRDGMMVVRWEQPGYPFEGGWACKGLFTIECRYALNNPIPDLTPQMQALMSEMKKDKKAAEQLYPEIKMIVVLPSGTQVKASDAHEVFEDGDGVNLLWDIDPYKTGMIKANFVAKL